MRKISRKYPGESKVIFLCAVFSIILMLVPWEQIVGRKFEDREVYLHNFMYLQSHIDELEMQGIVSFFVNESLWDFLVRFVVDYVGVDVKTIFYVITFFTLLSFSHYIVKRHGVFSLALLINPLVIDFAFSQLRMAFAASILLLAFNFKKTAFVILMVIFSCFIHTAVILFVFLYLVSYFIKNKISDRAFSRVIMFGLLIATGLVMALVVGPLRGGVLSYLGDRRAVYEVASSSILYASFWFLFLGFTCLQKNYFFEVRNNLFAILCVSSFLSMTVLAVPGLRFISAAFPFIVSSILQFDRSVRLIAIQIFSAYVVLQWSLWL